MGGSVLAIWVLTYTPLTPTGLVISGNSAMGFSDDFSINAINTNESDYSKTEKIYFSNPNGEILYNISIEEINVDVANDSCDSFENDVTMEILYNNDIYLNHGTEFNVTFGETSLQAQINASKQSCPQSYNLSIFVEPV